MPLSPLCQVREGAGSYVSTANGVDVSAAATVSIRLASTTDVTSWFLQVIGTDELSSTPILVGVNTITDQVTSPATVVTLVFPGGTGRAVGFRSEVRGTGGPIVTTFGVYSLTTFGTRVGFVTETREGNPDYGWATKINPLIRSGGGGGGGGSDNYTLTDVVEEKTIPEGQTMLFEDDVVIEDDGHLVVLGEVTAIRTEDNFSVLYVPQRSERIVQENDEMLFTEDLVIDGQLTVHGQITDASSFDSEALVEAIAALTVDPVIYHTDFSALANHAHYVWTSDAIPKTISLPASPSDGDRVEIVGLGGGDNLITINNGLIAVTYNASGDISASGNPFTFSGGNLRFLFVYRSAAATGFDAGWFNLSDSVTSQFGGSSPLANRVIVTKSGASSGQVSTLELPSNSLLGCNSSGVVAPYTFTPGDVLLMGRNGAPLGSYSPSQINPWSTSTLMGPGAATLEVDRINKYVASAGLILEFPSLVSDGAELQIKEVSALAGTAPDGVTLNASNPVLVENIGVGGNTLTDTLTEYKTWIKYKYDADGSVWRIVGAAYQLP